MSTEHEQKLARMQACWKANIPPQHPGENDLELPIAGTDEIKEYVFALIRWDKQKRHYYVTPGIYVGDNKFEPRLYTVDKAGYDHLFRLFNQAGLWDVRYLERFEHNQEPPGLPTSLQPTIINR